MKLVLNTWLAFQVEGAAEVAALATRLGVPGPGLLDALRGNPLASPYALGKLAKMFEHDDRADFSLDLALKDLDLATSKRERALFRSPRRSPSAGEAGAERIERIRRERSPARSRVGWSVTDPDTSD